MKGGAAGGGLSQIEPSAKINLHFHGDFHAISSAQSARGAIDAHLSTNDLQLDPSGSPARAMDMNDQPCGGLRFRWTARRTAGRKTGFAITAASEIMAIVALAKDMRDLRQRLDAIVIGVTRSGKPCRRGFGSDWRNDGAACRGDSSKSCPDDDGTPAFGTLAVWQYRHGTSSVICQQMGCGLPNTLSMKQGLRRTLEQKNILIS
jgi:formate--tetrahydrofolate ligase